jgi:hypothetical protein
MNTHRCLGLSRCMRVLLPAWLVLQAAGCGVAYYEQRLNETALQFAYYHKLNENLGEPWASAGMTLRVPQQFKPDLEQQQIVDDAGDVKDALVPRQPEFFPEGFELPGLVGAWRADVGVLAADGQPVPAHLYAMTNSAMFLDDAMRNEAPQFHGLVLDAVCSGIGIAPPAPEDPRWSFLRVPQGRGYVAKKDLTTITLVPDEPIAGAVREFRLYLFAAGEIQTAFLYVIPAGASSQEKIPERIELSFETLVVEPTIPRRTPEGAAGPATEF